MHKYIKTGLSKNMIGIDNIMVNNPVINDVNLNLLLFMAVPVL